SAVRHGPLHAQSRARLCDDVGTPSAGRTAGEFCGRPIVRPMSNALIKTALSYQRAGRLDDAERLYHEVLRGNARQIEALYLLGCLFFQRGAFEDALGRFDQVLEINPAFAEALAARAAVLSSLGRHAEALAGYDAALAAR